MDQQAKEAFRSGCLVILLLLVGLLAGRWLLMIEFGAAFHETREDRVGRTIAWMVLLAVLVVFLSACLKSRRQGRLTKRADSSRDPSAVPSETEQEVCGNGGPCCKEDGMERCPHCQSNEVQLLGREHSLHFLKHSRGWLFLFPALPLLLAQSPRRMKCEKCEMEFLKRTWFAWVYRILLIVTLLTYGWLFFEFCSIVSKK